MCSKLIIVPTPIGNLEDITIRALKVLEHADAILAEDTRTSSILLKKYGIGTHMESYHKFNEHKQLDAIVEKISKELRLPDQRRRDSGISDPGFCWSGPAYLPVSRWNASRCYSTDPCPGKQRIPC